MPPDSTSTPASVFRISIVTKIGCLFILLTLIYSGFLFITSSMTRQLLGVSTAIDEAGAQRMRVYRIGLLIAAADGTKQNVEAIREERDRWLMVWNGMQQGTAAHEALVRMAPAVSLHLRDVDLLWKERMRPLIDRLLEADGKQWHAARDAYLREADTFVASLSAMVRALERDAAGRIRRLYWAHLSFLGLSVLVMALALWWLSRKMQSPWRRLAGLSDPALAWNDEAGPAARETSDELDTLTQTCEGLIRQVRHDRSEIQALHATGQEISALGALSLDEVLKRIVDRAAGLVEADQAALFLQHPFMDCWIVEAASGEMFARIRKEILLFEQAPFVYQVYESRTPAILEDVSQYPEQPVRVRDVYGAKSALAVPLLTPHGCLGVLVLMSTRGPRRFNDSDVHLAEQFASYAAVTIENARLFESVEHESKLLKEKLAAVERQVAELTHEVKAPAGRVAEFAAWIEQDYGARLDDKARRYLRWIQQEGRDLASLADRTLNWSRLTQVPVSIESVDMRAVASEVLELLEPERARKGVRIDVMPDLPPVACQRIHVKQILENLLSNAIKYTGRQPHPAVQIGWGAGDQGPFFFVRDNGAGIDPAQIERIFLPFQRLVGEEAGAGIGLCIVKAVLEHYGGNIWADSQPGCGTTFYFTLPVLAEKPAMEEPVPESGAGRA